MTETEKILMEINERLKEISYNSDIRLKEISYNSNVNASLNLMTSAWVMGLIDISEYRKFIERHFGKNNKL